MFYSVLNPDDQAANHQMFVNVLDSVEPAAANLEHISLMHGTGYYGSDAIDPSLTPSREDDPRYLSPYFYYFQEDLTRQRQTGKSWTWSRIRPPPIFGATIEGQWNVTISLAVYATICKEMGLPLRFPGTPEVYRTLRDCVDADLLAHGAIWAATDPVAANQAINVSNGDLFCWARLWPQFGDVFGMDVAPPQQISLVESMADKGPLWDDIVKKYDLAPFSLERLTNWEWCDSEFTMDWRTIGCNNKRQRLGFYDWVDSEEMFKRMFARFREMRVIP